MSHHSPDELRQALDNLAHIHDKRLASIYVLLSSDGSTLVVDPGMGRPWSSPNKRFADDTAKNLTRQGHPCAAIDIETALVSILRHPKNQPPTDPS